MLSLALCTLGLQPGRLPLTRTAPLARAVSRADCELAVEAAAAVMASARFVLLAPEVRGNPSPSPNPYPYP